VKVPTDPARKATEAVLDREELVKVTEAGRKAGATPPAALFAAPTVLKVNTRSVAGKESIEMMKALTLTDAASTVDTAFVTTTLRQHAVDTDVDRASTVVRGCCTPSGDWVAQYTSYELAAARPANVTVAVVPASAAEARWDSTSLTEVGCFPATKAPQFTTPPALPSTTTVTRALDLGLSASWVATRLMIAGAATPCVGEGEGRTDGSVVGVTEGELVASG
jgi:hypothetical protein